MWRNEAVAAVNTIRYGKLSTHRSIVTALLDRLLSSRYSHSRNAVFQCNHGIYAPCECQLNRTSHLPAFLVFFTRGHHGTEGSDIEKVLTHPNASGIDLFILFQ